MNAKQETRPVLTTGKDVFVMTAATERLIATEQLATPVADLSNRLRHNRLREVHIHPESVDYFTNSALEKACCNTPQDMLNLCTQEVVRLKILEGFFLKFDPSEARWHFSILNVPGGTVIRVVVGDDYAMAMAKTVDPTLNNEVNVVRLPKRVRHHSQR